MLQQIRNDLLGRLDGWSEFVNNQRYIEWDTFYERVSKLSAFPKRGTLEYNWLKNQRHKYLTSEQTNKLELISWWHWSRLDKKLRVLEIFDSPPKSGHARTVADGLRIQYVGLECFVKRFDRKTLTNEEKNEIQRRVPWFDEFANRSVLNTKELPFDDMVAKVRSLKNYNVDKQLACWVRRQRRNYWNNMLDEQKIMKLETIDGWKWGRYDYTLDEIKAAIKQYYQAKNKMPTVSNEMCERIGVKWSAINAKLKKKFYTSLHDICDEIFTNVKRKWNGKLGWTYVKSEKI